MVLATGNLSPGAALAECAGRTVRNCAVCGIEKAMLGDGKYCSDSCNKKAYRQRLKEKEPSV